MTLSIMGSFATLSITTICIECYYAKCNYAECRISFIVMLNVVAPRFGRLWPCLQILTRLEDIERDKHTNSLMHITDYNCKQFYNTAPGENAIKLFFLRH
jgi:hypothetical protein